MRVWIALLALAGCDRVFGIGDPYEDAPPMMIDGTLLDMGLAGSDAPEPPLIAHFGFENSYANSVDGVAATCTGNCGFVSPGHTGASALELNAQGCVSFSISTWQPAFTVAMWVDPASAASTRVFTRQASSSNATEAWSLDGGALDFTFTTNESTGAVPTTSSHGMQSGQWTHVAVTYDGMTKRIYVAGQLDGSAATDQVITAMDDTAYIGCDLSMLTKFYGQIDEVNVYAGALSPDGIAALSRM